MALLKIAIDFGENNTCIFEKGAGIVLREPSLLAVSGSKGNYSIKAYGEKAKALQGKTDERTIVFSPFSDGEVKSVEYATELLKYYLSKITKQGVFKKDIEAVVVVPCGLSDEQKRDYATVCYKAKISSVKLVPSVITSALGGGKFVHTPTTYLIVNIGSSCTDIATVNMNTIIRGCTIGIGGKQMDNSIANLVADTENTIISLQTASELKEEIGSLFEHDSQNMEVVGVDAFSKSPKSSIIVSEIVRDAVLPLFERIAYAVNTTINLSSPDISSDITRNGVFFSGGVSKISGLEQYMEKRLSLPVTIIEDAEIASILGAGKLLSDDRQLSEIIKEF